MARGEQIAFGGVSMEQLDRLKAALWAAELVFGPAEQQEIKSLLQAFHRHSVVKSEFDTASRRDGPEREAAIQRMLDSHNEIETGTNAVLGALIAATKISDVSAIGQSD